MLLGVSAADSLKLVTGCVGKATVPFAASVAVSLPRPKPALRCQGVQSFPLQGQLWAGREEKVLKQLT